MTRNRKFYGKITIWPMVMREPSKSNSSNRPEGTMITKPINSVNVDVYREYLINKVIPAVVEKWPRSQIDVMFNIKHDNIGPHIKEEDPNVVASSRASGLDIIFSFQTTKIPHLNVLDLGYFISIHSLQYKISQSSADQLTHAVKQIFEELHDSKLNNVFLMLQKLMEFTIISDGNNNYKPLHVSKHKLKRKGQLPLSTQCSDEIKRENT